MAQEQKLDLDLDITRLEYGDTSRVQHAVLTICTGKSYSGGLISDATVYWVSTHSRQRVVGLGSDGGDYGKRLKVSERTVKATQRNIDRQHAEIFTPEAIEQLIKAAKEHYGAVVRAGIDGYGNKYIPATIEAAQ